MSGNESLPISSTTAQKVTDYTNVAKKEAHKADAAPVRSGSAAAKPSVPEKNSWQRNPKVKEVIEKLQGQNQTIAIALDPNTRKMIVEIVDSKTGERIRKLPLHSFAQQEDDPEKLKGLFVDATE